METSKAYSRRRRQGFFEKYIHGNGIDIGPGRIDTWDGEDKIDPNAFSWDKDNGDAAFMYNVADCTFHYVYASHTLEHIHNPMLALVNWWRILKPGGHLIISVPHRDLYEKRTVLKSKWNEDHKFFFLPDRSEGPCTISLFHLIKAALDSSPWHYDFISCEVEDEGSDHNPDPNVHAVGEYSIEAIVRKLGKKS